MKMIQRRSYKDLIISSAFLVIAFSTVSYCGDDVAKKVAKASNCFTLNFYKELAKSKGSLVSSPFSLDVLLSILTIGAGGETATELTSALGYDGLTTQQIQDAFQSLFTKIQSKNKNKIEVANSIWIKKGFNVKQSFKDVVTNKFQAKIANVDFAGNAHGATSDINAWGNSKTQGLIPTLYDQDLDPSTIMVLVNAIYLKGEWENVFDVSMTTDGDFYNNDSKNSPSTVKLMHQQDEFVYKADSKLNAQILKMDYKGGDMSMFVILPQTGSNVKNLEDALTCDSLSSAMSSGSETKVDVTIPNFKSESAFNLNAPIMNLGMKKLFQSSADFSGIAPGIFVSQAIQKAIIKVYEEGSEAAALTGMEMAGSGYDPNPPKVEYFRADHPFLYMIRHNPSNLILFIGRVSDLPNAS